jgi:hypothetical protein
MTENSTAWIADTADKVPQCPHWVILTSRNVLVDDGWDGNYRMEYLQYEVFLDEAEFEKEFKFRNMVHEVCVGNYVSGRYTAEIQVKLQKV